jgi:hypothetical protein
MRRLVAAILLCTAAAVAMISPELSAASAHGSVKACGTITWHQAGFTFHDRIYVKRGPVACATARDVLYDAYASPPAYGGWKCRYYEQRHAYVSCRLRDNLIYGQGT